MSFKTGDAWRRQKELEEERKAGRAPAEVDEDGKEINPHIPQYMTNAPWYLNSEHPTLKHQKDWREKGEDTKGWYERGIKTFQATKWRKGACQNCGALSHQTKDCLERPRVKGAKWTNKHIAADEKIQDMHLKGFDSKRDRWNGYDSAEYSKVVERYDQLETYRKENKRKEHAHADVDGKALDDDMKAESDEDLDDDDDTKLAEEEDAAFGEVKKRVRTTAGGSTGSVRNLRIREDTAKYLLNLNEKSAYYDPKSRSMREDPNPQKAPHEKSFAGDNFCRTGGDFVSFQQMELHSLRAAERGSDAHMQANPSLAETMYNQFKERKDLLQTQTKTELLGKYGNVAKPLTEDLRLLSGSERYAEYDSMGRVVKGVDAGRARSRYEEDVLLNNHKAVWGSWWSQGHWGFACCRSTVKNSYCIAAATKQGEKQGDEGAAPVSEEDLQMLQNMEQQAAEGQKAAELKRRQESKLNGYKYATDDSWGSAKPAEDLDSEKVLTAIKLLEEREKAALATDGEKGRTGFNSLAASSEQVTPEEMEAYRLRKTRADDPLMQAMQGKAEAVGGYEML